MKGRRTVVTGLGIVCPLGSDIESAWQAILSGKSGICRVPELENTDISVRIAGLVKGFNADDYLSPKEQRRCDEFIHYGIAAGSQAIADAGIVADESNAHRIGVMVGSGIGGLPLIEKQHDVLKDKGSAKLSPFFIPGSIINMVSGNLSIKYGFKGVNYSIVSACATGTHNIGEAARIIATGGADVMIAGGSEKASTALGIGGFAAARALSASYNDDPEKASRPWDLNRDGFVLGDGAGVVVLEEYEHAVGRGANIYCELVGYSASSDAYHITQPSPQGEGASRCMHDVLNDGALNPEDVDYLNAHGTSTPLGDKIESDAVKNVFKDHANKIAVSSVKSMIGHLLGAAGGVEAVFSVLTLRDQILPPTINIETPDPECDLDYVPGQAREAQVNCILSNSFGFGGTNASLAFRKI